MAAADKPTEGADAASVPSTTNFEMHVKTDEKSAAISDRQAGDASAEQKSTEVKTAAEVQEGNAEGSSPGAVGKLDVHLTYLWEVHRVNYYVGGEPPYCHLGSPCHAIMEFAWMIIWNSIAVAVGCAALEQGRLCSRTG